MRLALRASLLDLAADPAHTHDAVRWVEDGLLLVEDGRIAARGEYAVLSAEARAAPLLAQVLDLRGCIVTPGFVDAHLHLPQIDVVAAPAAGLLDWLREHTFPAEERFSEPQIANEAARFFLDQLARHGTTSAAVFGAVHAQSVVSLFAEAERRNVRLAAGKCLMDVNCPAGLRDTAEGGVRESADLAAQWHGRARLAYAITPRFAGTSSRRQLELAGELARARPDLPIQSHVAENIDEVRWIGELFPEARSYLDVYDRAGLLRSHAIYAHCIWLDAGDRRRMAASGATAAVCPTSNLFLGSGLFDFRAAADAGMALALATDVGGGSTFSMLEVMRAAYQVGRLNGHALSAPQLWYWATCGGAAALGWQERVGRLEPGMEADFIVLDRNATPLLARRCAQAQSTEDLLFALLMLGDDRAVKQTYIAGCASKPESAPE